MRKLIVLFLLVGAVATQASAKLNVVTTTEDLADIARQVGGSLVTVSSLVTGNRDPHFLEARPGFMSRVRNANLFIAIGLNLEVGYERAILQGSGNSKVQIGASGHLYASEGVPVVEKPSSVSRAQGDIHPDGNPHIWLDPYNARIMATNIANAMIRLDPSNANTYLRNLSSFQSKVDVAMFGEALVQKYGAQKLWDLSNSGDLIERLRAAGDYDRLGGWARKMAPHRGKAIVAYHRTWSYFVKRFGLRVAAELEPKPGIPPTPGHLATVTRIMKEQIVRVILHETYYSTGAAKSVAAQTGAKVVVAPPSVGADRAAKDYISLMDTIVNRLAEAL
ncbi:MAG: zinc ABC transporter substrate-binding protein [Armatimonadetes bacterium]|nr:MAG: zinc ABC transporter substrate-binding protein [Armatimonadota bacterium]